MKQNTAQESPRKGILRFLKICVILIFLGILFQFSSDPTKRQKINVICYRNGVGLNRDIDLLLEELSKLDHAVQFVDCSKHEQPPAADINVFVDIVDEYYFPFAKKNYLIPNPEWCFLSAEKINQFDLILCKTKEAQRIFQPLNSNSVYTSFTCKDRYDEKIGKNMYLPVHIAGASIQKGTDTVAKTWIDNPQFPFMLLLKHKGNSFYPPSDNLKVLTEYLDDSKLKIIQNRCGMHLCPSTTEGFGHYILEAMSCGNIVVTTDAPPMNEFITDSRCLVKYEKTAPWRWATNYYVDQSHLEKIVATLLNLSQQKLEDISRKNREFYLKNDQFFKSQLAKIFSKNFVLPQKTASKKPIQTIPWGETEYLWNLGIASTADLGIEKDPKKFFENYRANKLSKENMKNIHPGDVVWMRCKEVPAFYREVLPSIDQPIVLLISDGDESFPTNFKHELDVEELLANKNIIHVFAQNNDYKGKSEKVSSFPIGIDFHTIAFRGGYWKESGSPIEQEMALKEILKELKPTYLRKPKAYVDFHLADSIRQGDCKRYLELGEDRTSIFIKLYKTGLIDHAKASMRRSDLWKTKGQYAFSISPHGNGLDCHRTWEDLTLGCIVIVKTSVLDPLYVGLPVVIVKDWSEVNEKNMTLWLDKYKDAFTNPSYRMKLTNQYWLNKIKAITDPYKT